MRGASFLKALAILAAVSVVLSVAVVGCTPGQTPAPKENVLKVGVETFGGEILDPPRSQTAVAYLLYHVFDTAFEVTKDGTLAPGIVAKWEAAPDGLSWIFHLRNDVYFHDGLNADGTAVPRTKLTAKDLAFSYERSVAKDMTFGSNWVDMLGSQPKLEVVDDSTLRVYTNGPQPNLPILSSQQQPCIWVVPKAYIEKNGLDYFRSHPIGTGPYKFVRLVPGDQMEFVAAGGTHWSGAVPDFQRVIMYQIPEETTRVTMLEKGMLDATSVSLESSLNLKKKGVTIATGTQVAARIWLIGAYLPQAQGMPLGDIRVRKALSLAINRQEIIDVMFHGMGQFAGPARMDWYNADLTPALRTKWQAWAKENFRYDPDEAKRLIKEAGFAGSKFDVWVAPDAGAPWLGDLTLLLGAYWEKVGITANVVYVDTAAWRAQRDTTKSTQLIGKAGPSVGTVMDPSTIRNMDYWSGKGSIRLLHGSPDEAKMAALYTEGMSAMDPARIEKIIDSMAEIAFGSWTSISVVTTPTFYAFGTRVKGDLPPTAVQMTHYFASWKYTGKEP